MPSIPNTNTVLGLCPFYAEGVETCAISGSIADLKKIPRLQGKKKKKKQKGKEKGKKVIHDAIP